MALRFRNSGWLSTGLVLISLVVIGCVCAYWWQRIDVPDSSKVWKILIQLGVPSVVLLLAIDLLAESLCRHVQANEVRSGAERARLLIRSVGLTVIAVPHFVLFESVWFPAYWILGILIAWPGAMLVPLNLPGWKVLGLRDPYGRRKAVRDALGASPPTSSNGAEIWACLIDPVAPVAICLTTLAQEPWRGNDVRSDLRGDARVQLASVRVKLRAERPPETNEILTAVDHLEFLVGSL
ncbi:MAG: hypothetical protein KDB68_11580 [Planctomycetes bacterium]|nr:hypothetical protein [Planctomycetota bacterium]MCA8936831.1 hypothetical protein [Planctomycetota bacterium]